MSQWHGGKGSSRRQAEVPDEVVQDNWDNIFKKNKKTEEEKFDERVIMQPDFSEDIDPENPDKD